MGQSDYFFDRVLFFLFFPSPPRLGARRGGEGVLFLKPPSLWTSKLLRLIRERQPSGPGVLGMDLEGVATLGENNTREEWLANGSQVLYGKGSSSPKEASAWGVRDHV